MANKRTRGQQPTVGLVVARGTVHPDTPKARWHGRAGRKHIMENLTAQQTRAVSTAAAHFIALYSALENGWVFKAKPNARAQPANLEEAKALLAELLHVFPAEELVGRVAYIVSNKPLFKKVMSNLEKIDALLASDMYDLVVAGTSMNLSSSRTHTVVHNLRITKNGGKLVGTGCAATLQSAHNQWPAATPTVATELTGPRKDARRKKERKNQPSVAV